VNGEPSTVVSPGLWGFVAFFVLAVALYLLMRNMNARMRRMSYRAEQRQREAEEHAAQRKAGKAGADDEPAPSVQDGDTGTSPEDSGGEEPRP
jgi:flagellar biosynthesis/type III secretory pathway M-ring protein FliF/YscJ